MSETGDQAPRAKPSGRRWLRRSLVVVAALVVLVLAAGAIYAVTLNRSLTGNLNRADSLPSDGPSSSGSARPTKPTTGAGSESLNFVLMGSDSADGDAADGRSDTLMVAHLDADRKKAYLISFPRDMWVTVPGRGKDKINAAYRYGGPQLTVRTLESLLDTRMDHVALIDFEGFVKLTDSLGGVTVTNDTAFSSHGFDYPKGPISLSGDRALWYVRERKSLPNGDLDRAKHQRAVTRAILAKGLSGDTISNPIKFTAFVSQLAKYVTVDSTLSDADIRETALSLRLSPSDIESMQAPISRFAMIGTQSVDVVDEPKLEELGRAVRDDELAAYQKKYPNN